MSNGMAVGDALIAQSIDASMLYGVLGGLAGFFLGFLSLFGLIAGAVMLIVVAAALKTRGKMKMFFLFFGLVGIISSLMFMLAGMQTIAMGLTIDEVKAIEPCSGFFIGITRTLGLDWIAAAAKDVQIGTPWEAAAMTAAARIAGGQAPPPENGSTTAGGTL